MTVARCPDLTGHTSSARRASNEEFTSAARFSKHQTAIEFHLPRIHFGVPPPSVTFRYPFHEQSLGRTPPRVRLTVGLGPKQEFTVRLLVPDKRKRDRIYRVSSSSSGCAIVMCRLIQTNVCIDLAGRNGSLRGGR